ncbi:Gldg family protein [Pseudomonadota bacterium]
MQKKSFYSIGSLLLLLVFFVVASMLSSNLFRGLRFDLTENQLYTLSDGTRNILHDLQEPVTLYLFFSEAASRDLPQIRSYARRVDELVEEFVNHNPDKLTLKRIDPAPFSEEEDQATAFGLQAVPVGASGDSLYLGVAGSNSLDDMQAMPFLQPSKEKFLEYDLAKMVSSLGNPERKTLGLLSSMPMTGGFDPTTQTPQPAWVLHEQLSQLFQIEDIDPAAPVLPAGLDVLMLVHPKDLEESMLYQVEQFVLNGGHLIAYLDPFAEMDRGNPGDPMAQMQAGSSSSLGPMLDAWGVTYDPSRVVGDLQFGVGTSRSRHIGILSVPAEGLDDEDIITSDLEVVNFSSVGWFAAKSDAKTQFEPLVMSSENAASMDSSRLRFLTNPADLMTDFNPTGERFALAARLTGEAASSIEPPEGEGGEHLAASGESGINVVLIADTDVLSDRLWIQRQPFFGQDITTAFADNGSLAVNVIDNLLGNRDLISIRTRASSGRPFDRVDEIRVAAEKSYRATEERLQMELEDTERKLTELQAAKGESELTVISPEQQEEIQRFVDRKFEIRRELRQVQHDLQRDINSLGTRLKLLNIALVPAIVMVVALVYGSRLRRKQTRVQMSPVENP